MRSRDSLKKLGIALGVLVAIISMIGIPLYHAVDARAARNEWEAHRSYWEAKGENFDYEAFDSSAIANLDEVANLAAISLLQERDDSTSGDGNWSRVESIYFSFFSYPVQQPSRSDAWLEAKPFDLIDTFEIEQNQALTEFEAASLLLEAFEPIDDELDAFVEAAIRSNHAIAAPPSSRSPRAGDLPAENPLTRDLSRLVTLLQLRGLANLELGNTGPASRDVVAILRAGLMLMQRPILVDGLAGAAIVENCWQPMWQGLRTQSWNSEQLEQFSAACQIRDIGQAYISMMRRERAFMCQSFVATLATKHANLPFHKRSFTGTAWLYRNATSLSSSLQNSMLTENGLTTHDLTLSQVLRAEAAVQIARKQRTSKNSVLADGYASMAIAEVPRFALNAELHRRLAITAIAVESHRRKHGALPTTLSELEPGNGNGDLQLPTDPTQPGQPFSYGIDFVADTPIIAAEMPAAGVEIAWRYYPDAE